MTERPTRCFRITFGRSLESQGDVCAWGDFGLKMYRTQTQKPMGKDPKVAHPTQPQRKTTRERPIRCKGPCTHPKRTPV